MPQNFNLYMDGPTLAQSTGIYIESSLTICAPDGWYSDGVVIRKMANCVLQSAIPCPSCNTDLCKDNANYKAQGSPGIYTVNISSPNSGAFVFSIETQDYPVGIQVEYDGVIYNKLTSNFDQIVPQDGYLFGVPNLPTYIGESSLLGCFVTSPPNVAAASGVLIEYIWDPIALGFINTGNTNFYSASQSQLALTNLNPGLCYLVVPKLPGGPNDVTVTIWDFCGANWSMQTICPAPLPNFKRSVLYVDPENNCSNQRPINIYFFDSAGQSNLNLYVNDWVFDDPYGQTPVADGFYRTTGLPIGWCGPNPCDYIRVENGRIVDIFDEPTCVPGGGGGGGGS